MGPVALLVFKTSEPANTGLVGSTPTRLRQFLSVQGNVSRLDDGVGIIRRCVRPIVLRDLLGSSGFRVGNRVLFFLPRTRRRLR